MLTRAGRLIMIVLLISRRLSTRLISLMILMMRRRRKMEVISVMVPRKLKDSMTELVMELKTMKKSRRLAESAK